MDQMVSSISSGIFLLILLVIVARYLWKFACAVGNILPFFGPSLCTWRAPLKLGFFIGHARHSYLSNLIPRRKSSVFCSTNVEKEPSMDSDIQLANAKVIYSVAPAAGHNQVFFIFYYVLIVLLCFH